VPKPNVRWTKLLQHYHRWICKVSINGQAVLRVRNYKRTKHYKEMRIPKGRTPRVAYYQVVTRKGRILESYNTL